MNDIADGKTRAFHMCVDIEGVMRWPNSKLGALFTDEFGHKQNGGLVRDWLRIQLLSGKRVLPMGKPCDGFSYQTGCPGHEVQAEAAQ